MKTSSVLAFIFFILCFSCKKEVQDDENSISVIKVINIEKALNNSTKEKMNFSEFVSDITYVPLETN